MVKVMVTGATGLLGRAVVAELEAQADFEVLACGYRRAVQGIHRLDLTHSSQVTAFIESKTLPPHWRSMLMLRARLPRLLVSPVLGYYTFQPIMFLTVHHRHTMNIQRLIR